MCGYKKLITPHSFRRAFATELAKDSTHITHIALSMGHDNISTTQRYIKVTPDDLDKIRNPLPTMRET